jgi:hypothetical protein
VAFLSVLNGYKTYIAAAGLLGLSLFQFSTGQVAPAIQTLLSALAMAGLRSAIGQIKP